MVNPSERPARKVVCPACFQGDVVPTPLEGMRVDYKLARALVLHGEGSLPACTACGALQLDEAGTRTYAAACKAAYRQEKVTRLNAALRQLRQHGVRQWDLEPLLGLSPGYLSTLRVGKYEPGEDTVGLLLLLAAHPAQFKALGHLWAQPLALPSPSPKTVRQPAAVQGRKTVRASKQVASKSLGGASPRPRPRRPRS